MPAPAATFDLRRVPVHIDAVSSFEWCLDPSRREAVVFAHVKLVSGDCHQLELGEGRAFEKWLQGYWLPRPSRLDRPEREYFYQLKDGTHVFRDDVTATNFNSPKDSLTVLLRDGGPVTLYGNDALTFQEWIANYWNGPEPPTET